MRKLFLAAIAVLTLACTPPAAAPPASGGAARPAADGAATAAPRAPDKLKVGFSALTAAHSALWAAAEGGAFARNGIDVEIINLGSSQTVQASLVTGEVVVGSVGGGATLSVMLSGANIIMTGVVLDTMPYQVVAIRDIQSLADLRGKAIGVNRFGGSADFVARYVLRQAGIDPETQVTMLQVGAQAERMAALRGGALQATVVDPPMQTVAEREGYRLLLDVGEQNIPYPQNALVMNRDWIRSQRDLARRTLASVIEGARLFRTDRAVAERTVQQWLKLDDPALLDETIAYWGRLMPTEPLPRAEGLRLVIDEVSGTMPQAREMRPEDLVDPTLAAELQ